MVDPPPLQAGPADARPAAPAQSDAPCADAAHSGPRPWRRRALRLLRSVVLIYLGVLIVIALLQDWLIFPGHATQGQKHAMVTASRDSELITLTTSLGDRIVVHFGPALVPTGLSIRPDASSRPTLIFFYGNAMCLADAIGITRDWRKLGANVLEVEYPGYGMSSGKPGEQSFYAAADAAYDYLLTRGDIDRTKIVPVGLSLGSGPAVELATRRPVAALVLLAAYTSLDDMAARTVPFLPTSRLLKHHFRNEQKIRSLAIPILIIHGIDDRIVPHDMSDRLAKAAVNATVTRLDLPTDHNDLFELAGDRVNEAMARLLENIRPASQQVQTTRDQVPLTRETPMSRPE
ncbi:alpha/beta hydrolase [Fontivita pretiosa]|uniref:alpha/beta hydrolase n=1 Tax=Fontivita pretiosa TaxID=2989684 RepID=UPI003D1644EE